MRLKTLAFIGALATSGLFANTVTLQSTANNGVPDGNGGEFKAITDNDGTFFTFCLENQIHVTLNTVYNYTVDPKAYSGGQNLHGGGPGDPISVGTAWLYTQFALGNLVDSDGIGNYTDNRDVNAGLLQQAFWSLEDEVGYTAYTNYYTSLVAGIFGGLNNARGNYSGSAVQVMNLWNIQTDADVQSQLIYVPDSGMTVVLLALGVLGLLAFRRKS